MRLLDMFQERFLFGKTLPAFFACQKYPVMDCFYMPIEMVFVSESHDTKSAFKAFLVGMGDHMSSEM
jgi:hypothetical protein